MGIVQRLMFSLAGGVGIMVVELLLYIIREYKRDEIKKRGKKAERDVTMMQVLGGHILSSSELQDYDRKIKKQLESNEPAKTDIQAQSSG